MKDALSEGLTVDKGQVSLKLSKETAEKINELKLKSNESSMVLTPF
jgi:hypothetical protein